MTSKATSFVLLCATLARAYITDDGTVVIPGASSYNGLNLVPQMGWDNWNAFGCDVSEDLLLTTAQAMVDFGLKDAGYNYVVLDDCWSIGRNSTGYLVENPVKFPNGMAVIADQLHSMGMKFGMYSSAGTFTCGKYPGSLGHETKDAEYWAANGVDYLKYDNCYNEGQSGAPLISYARYRAMSLALNATGRPIVYSMCNWGNDNPFDWAYTISNSDRITGDIYASFNRPDSSCPCETSPCTWPGFRCSIMNILGKIAPTWSRTQPGWFQDLDMLEVGNNGIDDNEAVTHFSMWALVSSPLIIGTDIRTISAPNLAIYSNPAVIALNQDISGGAATRVWKNSCTDYDENNQCETNLWVRTLHNGDFVIALLNGANSTLNMTATAADIFVYNDLTGTSRPSTQIASTWDVCDLWANRMSDDEAQAIIDANSTVGATIAANSTTRWNATATSYADGLAANATVLFGTKVGTLAPSGTITAEVARHSVALYRLRKVPTALTKRDEL